MKRATMPKPAGRLLWLAGLPAAAALVAACSPTTSGHGQQSSATSSTRRSSGPSNTSSPASSKPTVTVHIKTLNADGAQYGIGMPVIAFFNHPISSAKQLQAATKVTADGRPITGSWYFETSSYYRSYPIEGHWRPQSYWPPHSKIHVDIAAKGLSAGGNLVFDDNLTLDFSIGASHILTVDDTTHQLKVVSDGKLWGTFPVSLGAAATPTRSGIKVIMDKGASVCMSGPGYHDCGVKWTQRLTYDGEYLHSAPWNCIGATGCTGRMNNIGHYDSSNGCTNLLPADAQKLYGYLEIGDVVIYPNANGGRMQLGQGYGDWNVPWLQWLTGGLVPTR